MFDLHEFCHALLILCEGCILDDRQSDEFAVQIQIEGVYAGVSVQCAQGTHGERQRLSRVGQAGGASFDNLNCPRRDDALRCIQEVGPFDKPAYVGFSSGGLAPFPLLRFSTGTSSGSVMGACGFFQRRIRDGSESLILGLAAGSVGGLVWY